MLKKERIRDAKHLQRIREMECLGCGDTPCDPAHIRAWHEGGMGLKPGDDLVVPLCRACHERQHRHGEKTFWQAVFSVNRELCIDGIKAIARLLYCDNNKT